MKEQEDAVTEIPIELIEEILVRLPVVDLLRFRCVSKKWRNLIDSPNFVKLHMNLPNKPQSVLIIDQEQRISYFDLDSVSNANSPANLKKLGEPCYEIYSHSSGVLGHINGLVCSYYVRDPGGVIIWNPWTKKHIQVPPPEEPEEQGEVYSSWGFGYDRDSDDYKVLALECLEAESISDDRNFVWIYSLRSSSWRSLDDCPYSCSGNVVFSDGTFYWTVRTPSDPGSVLICALDLGKLEYNLVPTPNLDSSTYHLERLGVLGGCLSAICRRPFRPEIDLWVMKDSWTLLIRYDDDYRSIIPLSCIQDGNELLFVTTDVMMSYECKTGSFKRVLRLLSGFSKTVVCTPSLVSPRIDP